MFRNAAAAFAFAIAMSLPFVALSELAFANENQETETAAWKLPAIPTDAIVRNLYPLVPIAGVSLLLVPKRTKAEFSRALILASAFTAGEKLSEAIDRAATSNYPGLADGATAVIFFIPAALMGRPFFFHPGHWNVGRAGLSAMSLAAMAHSATKAANVAMECAISRLPSSIPGQNWLMEHPNAASMISKTALVVAISGVAHLIRIDRFGFMGECFKMREPEMNSMLTGVALSGASSAIYLLGSGSDSSVLKGAVLTLAGGVAVALTDPWSYAGIIAGTSVEAGIFVLARPAVALGEDLVESYLPEMSVRQALSSAALFTAGLIATSFATSVKWKTFDYFGETPRFEGGVWKYSMASKYMSSVPKPAYGKRVFRAIGTGLLGFVSTVALVKLGQLSEGLLSNTDASTKKQEL